MKKREILEGLFEHIENNANINSFIQKFKEETKKTFFQKGMKKSKKELQTIYNLYNYGYYAQKEYNLYFDIIY